MQRQRQQRYADRKRAEATGAIPSPLVESERETSASRQAVSSKNADAPAAHRTVSAPIFTLKNPFQKKDGQPEKVKLFSNKEVDEELEKMTEIYQRGSGLLDDVLEIVVRDHEPVQIWQLDDDEAAMLAEMHLERAKTDEAAARSARKLLEIYDRLYIWLLVAPRLKATGSHIKKHKGFSFK